MSQIGTKLRRASWTGGAKLMHWCPACKHAHSINIEGAQPIWDFDGNFDRPTFGPSIKVTTGPRPTVPVGRPDAGRIDICHYFVKAGKIEFCGDCTHALSGQTVGLPDWPYLPGAYGGLDE